MAQGNSTLCTFEKSSIDSSTAISHDTSGRRLANVCFVLRKLFVSSWVFSVYFVFFSRLFHPLSCNKPYCTTMMLQSFMSSRLSNAVLPRTLLQEMHPEE
jgi:hypothetical protein